MREKDETRFDLESELRALTPRRRPEFTAALGVRVRSQLRGAGSRRGRLSLAFAVTAAIVVAFASLGGLGYAASIGTQTASAVRHAVALAPQRPQSVAGGNSAAAAQYKVSVCHRTRVLARPWAQISVPSEQLRTYLARGDYVVTRRHACPPPRIRCTLGSIVETSVVLRCTSGPARAGQSWTILLSRTVLARGKFDRKGHVLSRFKVPGSVRHGTIFLFRVAGYTEAIVRV